MNLPPHTPTYPTQVTLSATSPISDFETVEHHIAAGLPLTVNVHGSAAFSQEWGERVRRSPVITMVHTPEPFEFGAPEVATEMALPQTTNGRVRIAVLAVGILISATTVAMVAAFGLGI
jgi:hypothetical protein